jgi:hypothetical protein
MCVCVLAVYIRAVCIQYIARKERERVRNGDELLAVGCCWGYWSSALALCCGCCCFWAEPRPDLRSLSWWNRKKTTSAETLDSLLYSSTLYNLKRERARACIAYDIALDILYYTHCTRKREEGDTHTDILPSDAVVYIYRIEREEIRRESSNDLWLGL